MHTRLALSLTGDRLWLELLRAKPAGFGQTLRAILGRRVPVEVSHSIVARVEVATQMPPSQFGPSLDQALADLQSVHGATVSGTRLDVQLGLDQAQLGLVELSGISSDALAARNCDAYAQAWVAQMLHLNPSDAIVRWALLERSQKLLVSCTGRAVVENLTAFCRRSALRLSSCRPAVLATLTDRAGGEVGTGSALARDVVWTEETVDGTRSAKVLLLRLEGGDPLALWRGWVPRSECEAKCDDKALAGAIGRFQRLNSPTSGVPVERITWPNLRSIAVVGN